MTKIVEMPRLIRRMMSKCNGSKVKPWPRKRSASTCRSSDGETVHSSESEGSATSPSSSRGPSRTASLDDFALALSQGTTQEAIREEQLEAAMEDLAIGAKPWDEGTFGFVRTLQEAPRNCGSVQEREVAGGGRQRVAVKVMRRSWMQRGPRAFDRAHRDDAERPWVDVGLLQELNARGYPYACEMHGVFHDAEHMYVVTSLATRGDLFTWCSRQPPPSQDREDLLHPMVVQMVDAVMLLHEFGIVHRDLSLENFLVTDAAGGKPAVRLADYAMASLSRCCADGQRAGKAAYRPPEAHTGDVYDGFLGDAFSLGVVLFSLALHVYPWESTKPRADPLFAHGSKYGVKELLAVRGMLDSQDMSPNAAPSAAPLSSAYAELLDGLLQADANERLTLGESCYKQERPSVWDRQWLSRSRP